MKYYLYFFVLMFICSCLKKNPAIIKPIEPTILVIQNTSLNGKELGSDAVHGVSIKPVFTIKFNNSIDKATLEKGMSLNENSGKKIALIIRYNNQDSVIELTPTANLNYLSKYILTVTTDVHSINKGVLNTEYQYLFSTTIDSADKFNRISDNALLDTVQRRLFYYFWEMAHPVSGLILERNSSGDIVTTGGTGFGLMSFPIAVNRGFITRVEAQQRAQKIVDFLKTNSQKFHGAFPHWLNGRTGVVVPFSTKDNGADLVETSYLIAGLLTIRQYFDLSTPEEIRLREDINSIWNAVEWDWFRKSNENVLYWHWSPSYAWDMNMPIKGWNECLITYVLAASSNTNATPNIVYENGFTNNRSFLNGNTYYNYTLPVGPAYGGPLFWAHYSFLGINPFGLIESNVNYETQVLHHTLINYQHVQLNSKKYYGYSDACWGLTACDVPGGYAACDPLNDKGVIAPTAALSSFPFTPDKSMKALKFYYYTLGDKIWKEYGFMDSFSLHEQWYSNTALAIDQGPALIMIENYRSKLIWNLFLSSPELRRGMKQLGFTAPYLF